MRYYKVKDALKEAIQRVEESGPERKESLSKTLPALKALKEKMDWIGEARRSSCCTYAPKVEKDGFGWASSPSCIEWNEVEEMKEVLTALSAVPELKLDRAAQWFAEWLNEKEVFLLFPATTFAMLKRKYHGKVLNMKKLRNYEPEEYFGNSSARIDGCKNSKGDVSFWLSWNNQGEREFREESKFQVYREHVRLTVDKTHHIIWFGFIECFRLVNFNHYDFKLEETEKEAVVFNEYFCKRVDAVLAQSVKGIESKEILWRFDLENVTTRVSVPPRTEREDSLSYCCFRTDFTFDCDEVPHCCGECRLLKHVYKNLLPSLIDDESYARLKKYVTESGLFSRRDTSREHICFEGCPKKGECKSNVRVAVNEIYRAYFEAERKIQREKLGAQ